MSLLQRMLYTLLASGGLIYFLVKVALGYWKRRGILHEKPKKPWGHLKGVGRKRHITEVLASLYLKYKGQAPFVGFYAWLKPMILLLDIKAIENVLTNDAKYFMDRGLYYNVQDDPLSQNLLQTDGSDWQQLKLKTKLLQWHEQFQQILPALLKVQRTFESSLKATVKQQAIDAKELNITNIIESYNIDVISFLAFGLEGDSVRCKQTQFREMCKSYTQENFNIYKAYLAFSFPSLARLLQYRLYNQKATLYFQKLINDKLQEREYQRAQQTAQEFDFLQIFLESRKNQSSHSLKKMSNSEICAQAFNFILAGLQPSTTTLSCCLYELALQPDIQNKAREEVQNVLKKYNGQLVKDALKELVYVKQILKETLRKHSPYPFLLRLTTKDYELPDSIFMLQENNHLIVPVSAIHMDPEFFEYPEKFFPEHFHSERTEKRPQCAFLPYGQGPRACVAQHFCEMQMLVCLVTLLNNFKFSPSQGTEIPLQYDNTKLLLKTKNDIKLLVQSV